MDFHNKANAISFDKNAARLCKNCDKAIYWDKELWRHWSYINDSGKRVMVMTRCYDIPGTGWDRLPYAEPYPDKV